MGQKYIQFLTIMITIAGFIFITFLYWTEPRSIAEVSVKGQVVLGTYSVDQAEFEKGLLDFRRDQFPSARAAFSRADPQNRDALTQFYTAYSFYREGWGLLSNDDQLFRKGVEAVDRVFLIEPNFRVADDSLTMKTAYELKAELEDGLRITLSDFSPLRLTRQRK